MAKRKKPGESASELRKAMDDALNNLPEGVHVEHEDECQCDGCKYGIEAMKNMDAEMIEQYGWMAHYVVEGDDQTPTGANYHTHGVLESFGHKDFQIVLPIDPKIAHGIFISLIDHIQDGVKYEADGQAYDDVLTGGYKIRFMEAEECERQVLRVIIPDENGGYSGFYAEQLK